MTSERITRPEWEYKLPLSRTIEIVRQREDEACMFGFPILRLPGLLSH
jgi:hypothetical protein